MTDTKDIKALRELAFNANSAITRLSANGEECLYAIGEDPQIDKDVELSNQFHKAFNPIVVIYLLDQLEAEIQRADKSDAMLSECLESLKAVEKEISNMKGDQVPVAWKLTHITGAVCVEFNKEVADLFSIFNGNTVQPLYDRPQKPVVLPPVRRFVNGYSIEETKAAIEAAGGIVKDGD